MLDILIGQYPLRRRSCGPRGGAAEHLAPQNHYSLIILCPPNIFLVATNLYIVPHCIAKYWVEGRWCRLPDFSIRVARGGYRGEAAPRTHSEMLARGHEEGASWWLATTPVPGEMLAANV